MVLCLALLLVIGHGACRRGQRGSTGAPDGGQAWDAVTAPGMPMPARQEVRPVYPPQVTPDPLAERLCRALHSQIEERRAQCCQTRPAESLYSECVRTLSYSVQKEAIQLLHEEVARCEAGLSAALSGCEWVGPFPPLLPEACQLALRGRLAAAQPCRSSLECQSGQRCRGVGPTQMGVCGPPLPAGERCGVAVDPLAPVTRQEVDRDHPECAGFCDRQHVCRPALKLGEACMSSQQCGPGARCGKAGCVRGERGQLGEACSGGDCEPGLRCTGGRCIRPRREGEPCASAFECLGGGCTNNRCTRRCDLR
jgi:hypothetical protein